MRELTELDKLLLIQAFDGRPLHTYYEPRTDYSVIALKHENGRHLVEIAIDDREIEMLRVNFDAFKRNIADPAISSLDSAAYPERWKRLMPSFKRVAELMAEQDGRSAR